MHELAMAREIIDIVQAEMVRQNLHRVESVVVRIGALTGLNADALAFGFEASVVDTPLAGARLDVQQVPIKAKCRACGQEDAVEEFVFICPRCGGTDLEVIEGEELDIDHILGE